MNYKGIYFDDDNEKYTDPVTGAHFRFEDLWARIDRIRKQRGEPNVPATEAKKPKKELSGVFSNEVPSENYVEDTMEERALSERIDKDTTQQYYLDGRSDTVLAEDRNSYGGSASNDNAIK